MEATILAADTPGEADVPDPRGRQVLTLTERGYVQHHLRIVLYARQIDGEHNLGYMRAKRFSMLYLKCWPLKLPHS